MPRTGTILCACRAVLVRGCHQVSKSGHGWACTTASRADCSGHLRGVDKPDSCQTGRLPGHGRQSGMSGTLVALTNWGIVVSPSQVEQPSDVTALEDRHTVQLVHLCEYGCRRLFLRPLYLSASVVMPAVAWKIDTVWKVHVLVTSIRQIIFGFLMCKCGRQ